MNKPDLAAIEEHIDMAAPIQKPLWGRGLWRDCRDVLRYARQLEAERDAERAITQTWITASQEHSARRERAEAQVATLRAALAFYADEFNYDCDSATLDLPGASQIDRDWGKRARAALAEANNG